jgi:tetratricopeptide (TPR) repeat protein
MRNMSLAEMLLGPFIDLEPCARGPLYSRGVEQYWIAFADAHAPRFALQRTLPAGFRAQFLREVGLTDYLVEDPRGLLSTFRNARWSAICDALDVWPELTSEQQCRLVLLLHALCFYGLIASRIPQQFETKIGMDSDSAELAFRGASARYVLGLQDQVAEYDTADMSEFQVVLASAPPDDPVAFNAAVKVFVHKAKVGAPLNELMAWQNRSEQVLQTVIAKSSTFTRDLLLSRFYRAAAFVPQRQGNREEVVRIMDCSEHHALAMNPANDAEVLLYLENLHPVLESRTKEALWLGDLNLALARALRVIELDPYDSKAWCEVGQVRMKRKEYLEAAQAYAAAALLGPPASAIGRYMAGLCFRDLGQPLLAAFFHKAASEVDPLAISPHDEIQFLPNDPILVALKEWSLRSFKS